MNVNSFLFKHHFLLWLGLRVLGLAGVISINILNNFHHSVESQLLSGSSSVTGICSALKL